MRLNAAPIDGRSVLGSEHQSKRTSSRTSFALCPKILALEKRNGKKIGRIDD